MRKPSVCAVACLVLCVFGSLCAPAAYADKVFLKNGRSFECLVDTVTDDAYELDIGFGKTRVLKSDVDQLQRYDYTQNQALLDKWQRKKSKDEQDYLSRLEQERKARLAEKEAAEHAPRQVKGGQTSGGHVIVEALLNNKVKARLIVDTGASMVLVSKSIAEQLGIRVPATRYAALRSETIVQSVVADGRTVDAKLFTLDSVQVQDAQAANVAASVVLAEGGAKDFDGLLGMSFLQNFKFSLDSKNGTLTLEKNK